MSWSKSDKKSPMQTILQQECAIPTLLFFNAVQTDVRCLPLTTVLSSSYLKVHKTYIMNVQLYLFVWMYVQIYGWIWACVHALTGSGGQTILLK